jgi:hypothetical protein
MTDIMPTRLAIACILAAALPPTANSAAPIDDERLLLRSRQFASDLAREVRSMLFAATAIDPVSWRDNTKALKSMRRRHREIHAWLTEKGSRVSWTDCSTERDRMNFRAYPNAMSNRVLLGRSRQARLRYVRTTERYLLGLTQSMGPGLVRLLSTRSQTPRGQPTATDDGSRRQMLAAWLMSRLTAPLHVESRFLNRDKSGSVCALYVPDLQTMFIDMDQAATAPHILADSLEHELWHHMLPPLRTDPVRELLREGFTEMIAEIWGSESRRAEPTRRPQSPGGVEYPFETAVTSLLWATAPYLMLEYMMGMKDTEEVAAQLRPALGKNGPSNRAEYLPNAQSSALADGLHELTTVPERNRLMVEQLLTGWGWREDDRSRISIGFLLNADKIAPAVLEHERVNNGLFARDIARAFAVCFLRNTMNTCSPHPLDVSPCLPEHVADNLRRALKSAAKPATPFAQR